MTRHDARYAIRCHLHEGELDYRQCKLCDHFVTDAITALRLLRDGQVVWIKQDAALITSIQRSLQT